MGCYSNARLLLPPSAILYNNSTLQSCQCLSTQENVSGFQYSSNENLCYIFGNDSLRSNLRIQINSQVCFVNRTSIVVYPETTTGTAILPLPSPPVTISTSVSGNDYYAEEDIFLNNIEPLTSLLIVVTVPKTLGVNRPSSYTTFWANTVTNIINDTDVSTVYIFQIINGTTIVSGQWKIGVQYNLNGQVRPTSNDTYIIQTGLSYQEIDGHF